MQKKTIKKGQLFGEWKTIEQIFGSDKTAIWKVVNNKGDEAAIKVLKRFTKKTKKPYKRFRDEINVLSKNPDIKGILPIIDFELPENISKAIPWYVMPIAGLMDKSLDNSSAEEKIEAIIQISKTLEELHNKNITHRDIKPANLFKLNDLFCIGDFGICEFPDKEDVTRTSESLGPKWTMAPEMKCDPKNADGKPADVYSLAKTLWILLTGEKLGFDGQYYPESINRLNKYQKAIYTDPLDTLFTKSTDNDPLKRPSIREFIKRLEDWLIVNKDFEKKNHKQWEEIQFKLFPVSIPLQAEWQSNENICSILNETSAYEYLNHMLIPTGGGVDLVKAVISTESNCIELHSEYSIYIVKPIHLRFESFNNKPSWNYFILKTGGLWTSPEKVDRELSWFSHHFEFQRTFVS